MTNSGPMSGSGARPVASGPRGATALLLLVAMAPMARGQERGEDAPRHRPLQRYEAGLKSSRAEVRLLTVRDLGDETGPAAAELLMQALEDPSVPVLLQAMDSLLEVGPSRTRAAPRIEELLRHDSQAVRERARATLVGLGVMESLQTPYLVSVLQQAEDPSIELVTTLGRRAADAPLVAPELAALLSREDAWGLPSVDFDRIDVRLVFQPLDRIENWRHAALASLVRLGPEAVAARHAVVAMTDHPDPLTRVLALRALATSAPFDAETDRVLMEATTDEMPYVRASAYVEAVFVSILRGERGADLAERVQRRIRAEEEESARAIGRSALELREPPTSPRGRPALLQGTETERGIAELLHRDEDIRIHGANLLATAGPSENAVQALRGLLISTRDLGTTELLEDVGMAGIHLYLHTQGVPPSLADSAGRPGPGFRWFPGRACHPIPRLHSRLAAIEALGSYGPEALPAVPDLLRLTRDRAWRLRQAAWRALGRIDAKAIPDAELREAEEDPYREVRQAAKQVADGRRVN